MKNLIPWGKKGEEFFQPMAVFQKKMNDVFEDFFKGFEEWPMLPWKAGEGKAEFMPRIDVAETEKEIKVTAELPGLTDKDVEVYLDNNVLSIKGEKHHEHEEKDAQHHYVERRYGSFYRSIPLPVEVVEDKIEASCNNGILHISMPKKEIPASKAKKITIKGS